MANPCRLPRFTSDTPTASARPPFAAARNSYQPDHQQPCEPWLFVLREDAENYVVPEPRTLGLNGSFAVFKKVETDVVGFEDFLQSNKDKIDPELLAAKMCGRWRNGVPLALSPDTDSPAGGISPEQLNDFEYVNADGSGDPKGIRCPVGAHIRRVNPRGQPIAGQGVPGGSNNSHRMIRRGLPYGPTYDPGKPYDGIERGMLFYFINANIENQYEFVLRRWVNDSEFAGAVRLRPEVERSTDRHPGPSGKHLRHTAGRWGPADRGDRSLELRYDQSRCVRVSAEHHGHQIHRRLVTRTVRRTGRATTASWPRSTSACRWRTRIVTFEADPAVAIEPAT